MKDAIRWIKVAAIFLLLPGTVMAKNTLHNCGVDAPIVKWVFGKSIYNPAENELSVGMGFALHPEKDRILAFVASQAQQIGMVSYWRADGSDTDRALTHKILREDGSELAPVGTKPYLKQTRLIYDITPGKYCVFLPGVDAAHIIYGAFTPFG